MLFFPVYTESHPRRIAAFASRMNLRDADPATTGFSVCKRVTPTTPTGPTGSLHPFSFQSLARSYSPSCSNGTPFISFDFILLRTLSLPTGGYTPLLYPERSSEGPVSTFPSLYFIFHSFAQGALCERTNCAFLRNNSSICHTCAFDGGRGRWSVLHATHRSRALRGNAFDPACFSSYHYSRGRFRAVASGYE